MPKKAVKTPRGLSKGSFNVTSLTVNSVGLAIKESESVVLVIKRTISN